MGAIGDNQEVIKETAIYENGDKYYKEELASNSFSSYLKFVQGMKKYPEKYSILYPTIKLNGEAGEVAEKVGKVLRDENGVFSDDKKKEILKELGDCLWYISSLADDLGFTLQDVVDQNVEKLSSRKERGVLHGSGDNR